MFSVCERTKLGVGLSIHRAVELKPLRQLHSLVNDLSVETTFLQYL